MPVQIIYFICISDSIFFLRHGTTLRLSKDWMYHLFALLGTTYNCLWSEYVINPTLKQQIDLRCFDVLILPNAVKGTNTESIPSVLMRFFDYVVKHWANVCDFSRCSLVIRKIGDRLMPSAEIPLALGIIPLALGIIASAIASTVLEFFMSFGRKFSLLHLLHHHINIHHSSYETISLRWCVLNGTRNKKTFHYLIALTCVGVRLHGRVTTDHSLAGHRLRLQCDGKCPVVICFFVCVLIFAFLAKHYFYFSRK